MKFIDLSVIVNEDTPVYPGDPKTKIDPGGIFAKYGYEDHYICFGTHVGTHVDAPRHMIAGGKTLDQFPIDIFAGRGVYIKVANREFDLGQVKKADIHKDDIVLFHTGMSDMYHRREYYDNYTPISEDIANYLVEKKVKMVGVDMCSVDHEPIGDHKILLGNNI